MEKIKHVFLSDKAEGNDSFASQAHSKIAKQIKELILCNDEYITPHLIGVEGKWGSGKSNVIKIVEKEIEEEQKQGENKIPNQYIFFYYDAWAHQEDLQRRSFLENLTEKMVEVSGCGEENVWENSLTNLLARKTRTEQKEVPALSKWMLLFLGMGYIFNLIANSLGSGLRNLLWKFLILLSFIAVIIMCYCYKKYFKKIDISFSELFYLYREKTLNKTLETITSTEEPSVREFKKWMNNISQFLGEHNKKMIIVYDNIDRLPPEKVSEIWSSVHTFFSEQRYDNITVIVPFSKEHLLLGLKANDDSKILEKTFQVVYKVTPPVLKDWKEYFSNLMKDAFENIGITEMDIESIRILYDKRNYEITPRDIKIFINDMLVLNSIYDDIPLKYVALYVLFKKEIDKDFRKIILEDFDSDDTKKQNNKCDISEYIKILGKETPKYLSALYFGVTPNTAIQTLLGRDIEVALRNGNYEVIDNCVKVEGFFHVLETVVFLFNASTVDIEKLVLAIKNIEPNKEWEKILNHVVHDLFDDNTTQFSFKDYHKILIKKCPTETAHIIKKLASLDISYNTEEITETCNEIMMLDDYAKDRGIDIENDMVEHTCEPDLFLQVLKIVDKKYKRYKFKVSDESLDSYLEKNIKELPKNMVNAIKLVLKNFKMERLKKLTSALFENKESKDIDEWFYIVLNEELINTQKTFGQLELQLSSFFSNSGDIIEKDSEIRKYVLCIFMSIVAEHPDEKSSISYFDTIFNITDNELLNQISEIIVYYISFDKILELFSEYKSSKFIKKVLNTLYKNNNIQHLNVLNVLKNYNSIRDIVEDNDIKKFFEIFDQFYMNSEIEIDYKDAPELISKEFMPDISQFPEFKSVDLLQRIYIEYFKDEDTEKFLFNEISGESYDKSEILSLLLDRNAFKISNSICEEYIDILKNISKNKIKLNAENIKILDSIYKRINKEILIEPITIDIKKEYLKDNRETMTKDEFLFFIDKFINLGVFNEHLNTNDDEIAYLKVLKTFIFPFIDFDKTLNVLENSQIIQDNIFLLGDKVFSSIGELKRKIEEKHDQYPKISELIGKLENKNNVKDKEKKLL
ncbi:hypothetical protein IX317_001516 [Fusobacterium sp. DD29]|uniref:P-loop NTPase fold protein n=1 Tax=unclassified Fusobacterium TaxID=2648384 RepID=UPI001B8B748E|nr:MULTISPECIES: P-loop NTPase fold protein [unclassified Fusobacterium]MBR8701279.1 hypothetical protein [Fusobacterium sp. DD45]MBR8711048.1 hypothetical protein [Fusobacterium sp. DD28]MBR8749838.1 hypothetical protein [Fusobacterium sp. DD29]MBR8751621.1 hypothetical protein [Fusobacterium sp. DD26]MBR8762080.1 hypothetical protein [Fusobacterium sp. DD25]